MEEEWRGTESKLLEVQCEVSSQVTFIYIALLTIQIVSKHLTVSNWRIEYQQCIMTRLNTQFSVKGISLLNSEMSLSSSV